LLLWFLDVRPQRQAYAGWVGAGRPCASWLLPTLTGVGWVAVSLVINYLARPLSAREDAERFAQACQRGDAETMRRYTDQWLHFAVSAMPALEKGSQDGYFKLLGEKWGREGPGGARYYEVEFTRGFRLNGANVQVRGTLMLLPQGRTWLIHDMVYHEPTDVGITHYYVATEYPALEEQVRLGRAVSVPLPSGSQGRPGEKGDGGGFFAWLRANVVRPFCEHLVKALVLAAAGGVLALCRRWWAAGQGKGVSAVGAPTAAPARVGP
jgi:hypothetical protein